MRLLLLFSLIFCACQSDGKLNYIYESETLKIHQVSEHCYQHISLLQTKNFGLFPCNGMVVMNKNESLVIDTPVDSLASAELIRWIKESMNAKINYVVPTHFHVDCTGGLNAFHAEEIPSISSEKTLALSEENSKQTPQLSFEQEKVLTVGDLKVDLKFYGEGHTKDNITVMVKKDKVLFGGCLIKSDGSGKGNLADANVSAWSTTVKKLKEVCDKESIEVVIPGHGQKGGLNLLDYTIEMFEK